MTVGAEPSEAAKRIIQEERRCTQEAIHRSEVALRIEAENERRNKNRNDWWIEEDSRHARAREEQARLRRIGERSVRSGNGE